jgi:hypothetical protein
MTAVAIAMDFDDGTLRHYDEVTEEMGLGRHAPRGALFHASGLYEGHLRVVDVWESLDRFRAFADAELGPLASKHGLSAPRMRTVEVSQERRGDGTETRFLQVVTIPGLSEAEFRGMDEKILPGGSPPDGLVYHVNGPIDGGWCVIDTWTSKAARDRFLDERILPGVQAAGITATPTFEDMEVHNTLAPAGAGAAA